MTMTGTQSQWVLPAIWLATGAVTLISGDTMMAAVWFLLGAGLLPMNLVEGSRRKRWYQTGVAVLALVIMALVIVRDASAQGEETYTEPEGRWSAPIPAGWTVDEAEGYVLINSPEGDLRMYLLVSESDDYEQVAADGWALVDPEFDRDYDQSDTQRITDKVLLEKYDEAFVINYAVGLDPDGAIVQAAMSRFNGLTYVFLIDTNVSALQRRVAQFQTIATGFIPTDMAKDDLTGAEIAVFDEAFFDTLTSFAESARAQLEASGVSFAVVRDGAVVYSAGLGSRDDSGGSVTGDTRMMIGSVTKTMTTLLMAQAVDAGAFSWDTPVVVIDPGFAVADPDITAQITMANLVCACTGVPRRDYEMIYNGDLTADDILAQIETFEFFTGFGETFQYSNQLVAAGGYEIARALDPAAGDLLAAYVAAVQQGIFDPVGMPRTTFDFDAVLADADYAIPYGSGLDGVVPLEVDAERFLLAVAPAGAVWSTANDMGRYLAAITEGGVTADGTRIVSAENLARTQQPGVSIDATTSYGLGWILSEYKSLPVRSHDGNTLGFSSAMSYLPDSEIGIVVLANQQGSALPGLVAQRFYELALGETDSEASAALAYIVEQRAKNEAEDPEPFVKTLDAEFIAPYIGTFANDILGTVTLTQDESGTVSYDSGEFVSEVWSSTDEDSGEVSYLLAHPPLAGDRLRFALDESGTPTITIGLGVTEYVFVKQ